MVPGAPHQSLFADFVLPMYDTRISITVLISELLRYTLTDPPPQTQHRSIVHLSYIHQGEVSFQNPLWRGTVTHGLPSWSVENSSQTGPCTVLPSRYCGWTLIGNLKKATR